MVSHDRTASIPKNGGTTMAYLKGNSRPSASLTASFETYSIAMLVMPVIDSFFMNMSTMNSPVGIPSIPKCPRYGSAVT